MKLISTILLSILSSISFSQEHSTLFQAETMKKNRVLKVLEYNPDDSIHFFQQFPEGYYSRYDKSGRMIESNHYASYEEHGVWHPEMFTNYYMHDSSGRQIGFISIYEDSDQPFRYIDITSPRKTSDSVDVVHLTDQYKPGFRFITEPANGKKAFYGDTLVLGKRHKRLVSIEDSSIYMDFYYTKLGLMDSTVFHGKGYQHIGRENIPYTTRNVTHYLYFQKNVAERIIKENYRFINGVKESDYKEEYFVFENGLIDQIIRSRFYPNQKPNIHVSKFTYTFRKK